MCFALYWYLFRLCICFLSCTVPRPGSGGIRVFPGSIRRRVSWSPLSHWGLPGPRCRSYACFSILFVPTVDQWVANVFCFPLRPILSRKRAVFPTGLPSAFPRAAPVVLRSPAHAASEAGDFPAWTFVAQFGFSSSSNVILAMSTAFFVD